VRHAPREHATPLGPRQQVAHRHRLPAPARSILRIGGMVAACVTTRATPTAAKAARAPGTESVTTGHILLKNPSPPRASPQCMNSHGPAASIGDAVIIRYIDIAEFERPDDLFGWRIVATEHPVEHCAVNALSSRPRRLASRSSYLRAKQVNHALIVEY